MSLSKIIRNSEGLDCRRVIISDLSTVTQAESSGFVVVDSSHMEQAEVESSAVVSNVDSVSVDLLLEQQKLDLAERFEEGRQRGVAEAEQSFAQTTQALASACEQISNLKEKMLERSQPDMLRLVFAIAERVVQANVQIDTEVITRTVRQAIHLAVSAEEFHIRINPEDLHVVNDHKPLFIASLSGLSNIEFVPDESLTRGGCILESPLGRVDATMEAQLEAISNCLQEATRGE